MTQSDTLITLEIPRHLNDVRVDSAVATLLNEKMPEMRDFSRSLITRHLKVGRILCNGKAVPPRFLVATHDVITIQADIFEEQSISGPIPSQNLALKVLFENDDFLVLDKGAGVQMHMAGGEPRPTVASWIVERYPALAQVGENPLRPGIVHRLDRDTSGVLVVAKTNEAFSALKHSFQERSVSKKYVALVYGHLKELSGSVDALLMREPGELRRRAVDPHRFSGTLPGNARTAYTEYRVFRRYEQYDLVELTPKTGRTHQIRVHLAFLGHPVVGDRLYAWKDAKKKDQLQPSRHLLHAGQLSFELFGKQYTFESPLPADFQEALSVLDETLVSSYDGEALDDLSVGV